MDELPDPLSKEITISENSDSGVKEQREKLECAKLIAEIRKAEAETVIVQSNHALTAQKLQEEIRDLRRSLWSKPMFYSAMVPIVLTISGVFFSWRSGWFDAGQKKLDAERLVLQIDIKDLERKKLEYSLTISNLVRTNDMILSVAVVLSNRVAGLTKERDDLEKLKNVFKAQAEHLAGADTNLQTLLKDFTTTRLQSELFQRIAAQFWSDSVKAEITSMVTNAFPEQRAQFILRDVETRLPEFNAAHVKILNEVACDPSLLAESSAALSFASERLTFEKAAAYPELMPLAVIRASQHARPAAPQNLRIVLGD